MPYPMYQQQYSQYTIQQQQTWNILYTRRQQSLSAVVAAPFWQNLHALELKAYFIPEFQKLNFRLGKQSDWQVEAVAEPLRPKQVLARWSRMQFPALTTLRPNARVDMRFQESRDLFEDVFCLLPWVLQPEVSDFMQRLGQLSVQHKNAAVTDHLWSIIQHVLGYGLLRDAQGGVSLFGARLLSNASETEAALANDRAWQPFDLKEFVCNPDVPSEVRDTYVVLESLSDLNCLAAQLEKEDLSAKLLPVLGQMVAG
jgi:phenylalanine-4-hydroxylase